MASSLVIFSIISILISIYYDNKIFFNKIKHLADMGYHLDIKDDSNPNQTYSFLDHTNLLKLLIPIINIIYVVNKENNSFKELSSMIPTLKNNKQIKEMTQEEIETYHKRPGIICAFKLNIDYFKRLKNANVICSSDNSIIYYEVKDDTFSGDSIKILKVTGALSEETEDKQKEVIFSFYNDVSEIMLAETIQFNKMINETNGNEEEKELTFEERKEMLKDIKKELIASQMMETEKGYQKKKSKK
jgi:hypothetical protein